MKDAKSIRGTNPQYLIEKIIRSRVYDSKYWKEECFALTAELLVDKAMELRLGNIYCWITANCNFYCTIAMTLLTCNSCCIHMFDTFKQLKCTNQNITYNCEWKQTLFQVYRWCIWWKCKTNTIPLSDIKDAPDTTWEGYYSGVYKKRGIQVCSCIRGIVYEIDWIFLRLLQIFGTVVQWQQKAQETEQAR